MARTALANALSGLMILSGLSAMAQVERVTALHAIPRPGNPVKQLKTGDLHQHFVYANDPVELPVNDDFSVDRTRHLNAQAGDPNVTLNQTIYRIEVGGASTPDMAFVTEPSLHYTWDVQPDTLIVTVEHQDSITAIIYDLSVWPVTEQSMYVWPPYDLLDIVGNATTDTLTHDPTLVQDSLLVYDVSPDPRTYTNPDNSITPYILWADDDAYVNGTFPLNPPTIGVATLDGMDRTGWPYMPDSPNTEGTADHLTSVPINLAYPASDSIYLSFLCEPIGTSGDQIAHAEDSLHLELYAPDEDAWYPVWSTPGDDPPDQFKQVMIPVTEARYLKDGFRMRFRNDATLGGAVDQWNVDYVRLGRNRTATDTVLKDVAYVYPEAGLLQTYTSVPYADFIQSPSSYMAQQVDLEQRNNDIADKFITWGYGVGTDCGWSATRADYGNNISNNAYSNFTSTHPVNSGDDPLVYDLSGCTGAAFATAKFWTNATPDACAYNDTMVCRQEISNYYSYDDGTAEAGYNIANGTGSKIAYRFQVQGTDSLRALRVYFDPIFTYDGVPSSPLDGSFLITVWSNLSPETVLFQNISFSVPEYHTWGPDHFVEYPLDSTIAVSGTFYVGWVQTNDDGLSLGLDRNRDNHDKMFYNTGFGWLASGQTGSWMIRPVVAAAVDPYAGVHEVAAEPGLAIWPNPADAAFNVRAGNGSKDIGEVELMDPTGRPVKKWAVGTGPMSVQDVAVGVYLVRATGRGGRAVAQGRLIVRH